MKEPVGGEAASAGCARVCVCGGGFQTKLVATVNPEDLIGRLEERQRRVRSTDEPEMKRLKMLITAPPRGRLSPLRPPSLPQTHGRDVKLPELSCNNKQPLSWETAVKQRSSSSPGRRASNCPQRQDVEAPNG